MKALRVLRVLRPLKTINRVPKLKVTPFRFFAALLDTWSVSLAGRTANLSVPRGPGPLGIKSVA